LGIALALIHLRGSIAPKPGIGYIHGIFGTIGFGLLVIALQGPRRGDAMGAGSFGFTASIFFAIALAIGWFIPLLIRRLPHLISVTIVTHASLAVAGFVLFLAWRSAR
jgi:hypothetical protein